MAYKKPGIEVLQKQVNASPILSAPELETCVVGVPYKWYAPEADTDAHLKDVTYSPSSTLTINASGIHKGTEDVVDNSIVIDLQEKNTGKKYHLDPSTDFTFNSGSGEITLVSGLTQSDATPLVGLATSISGMANNFQNIESEQQLKNRVGDLVSWNPLGYGAAITMRNSGASTSIVGISEDTSNAHAGAIDELELKDSYVIAPMTQQHGGLYKTHVTSMSLPANKKERIAFVSPTVDYSSGDKQTIAEAIRDANSAIGEKRYFSVHPDAGYTLESRHVSTLRSSFIQAFFGVSFSLKPLFVSETTIGTKDYAAFSEITDAIVDELIAQEIEELTVLAPVPGYYYSAMVAGMCVNKSPEEPLTNVSGTALAKVYRSNTYFSEAYLNTIASGGTFILVQDNSNAPIYCRHQLSTDNSSIEKSELSITMAIDYTAKYLRSTLKPYIGRFNIDPGLLGTVNAVFEGIKKDLIRRGIIADMALNKLEQDSISKDTINLSVTITPKYPANQIKITLQF